MRDRINALMCVVLGLVALGTRLAHAEVMVESIQQVFISPGESFEEFYPNEFDLDDQKRLTFEGTISNTSQTLGTTVGFWFDWIDPRVTGDPVFTSDPVIFTLGPVGSGTNTRNFSVEDGTAITYTIPFCPPEVSIHISNGGFTGKVFVSGTFTHECLNDPVPEPAMVFIFPALLLMAPLALRGVKMLGGRV